MNFKVCDVLVIGAGASGMLAALKTSRMGLNTIIAYKGMIGKSSASWMAGADFTIYDIKMQDQYGKLQEDILRDGFFINEQSHVEQYAKYCTKIEQELLALGLHFRRNSYEHGMKLKRAGFIFGWEWCQAITDKLLQEKLVIELGDSHLVDLLYEDKRCVGGIFFSKNKNYFAVVAQHTILATGGWAGNFPNCTASKFSTGEGIAAAARIGAELSDMEFVQFVPYIPKIPSKYSNGLSLHFLMVAHDICEILRDGTVNPLNELGIKQKDSKEVVCLGLSLDYLRNYSSNYQVVLKKNDFQQLPLIKKSIKSMLDRLPSVYWNKRHLLLELLDYLEGNNYINVELAPHFTMGGICINQNMQSTIDGLYAVGECRGGLWGAGRVYSACSQCHSDVENLNLLNKRCGIPNKNELDRLSKKLDDYINNNSFQVSRLNNDILQSLRLSFSNGLGPIRNQEKLFDAQKIANKYIGHKDLRIRNLALILKLATTVAEHRKETRGCHIRQDYQQNEAGASSFHIVYHRESHSVSITSKNISKLPHRSMSIEEQIMFLKT